MQQAAKAIVRLSSAGTLRGSRANNPRTKARIFAALTTTFALFLQGQIRPQFAHADITYGYDADGRLVCVSDGQGNQRGYVYDSVGNLLQIVSPCQTTGDLPAVASHVAASQVQSAPRKASGLFSTNGSVQSQP